MTMVTCPFTEIPIDYDKVKIDDQVVSKCTVTINNNVHRYFVPHAGVFNEWNADPWFIRNKHLIKYSMENGYPFFDNNDIVTIERLKQRLSTSTIPHTPKMMLDHLLNKLADALEFPGDRGTVTFTPDSSLQNNLRKFFFVNTIELKFYANTLKEQGLIKLDVYKDQLDFELTFKGLSYLAELEDAGALSKNCFVAMAFDDSRVEYREAIIKAVKECGYTEIIVDTRNIDSDKTINDHIISEIRRCKFCISDFTLQKNGVYFEAGFALGLGKPVIYVCEKEDFIENSHFDLKPFQHILYTSSNELQIGLERKIKAWIQ